MAGAKRFYGIMKPRYLLLFIINLLAFNQGLLMDETTKCRNSLVWNSKDRMGTEYGIWNLMGKALLDIMGVVLFGYLAHSFGRKKSLISLGIISLLFQIMHLVILTEGFKEYVNYSDHPYYHYYDIACQLVNSAPLLISTIYIGETAQDSNRGVFVSSYIFSNRLGQLIHSAAKFWEILNYLGLANILLSVVFVAAAFWLPETPIYLLLNNRTEDAKKALRLLQGNVNIEGELKDLIVSVEKSNSSKGTIMSFITNPAIRKALIIGSVTLILNRLLHTWFIIHGYLALEMSLIPFSGYNATVLYKTWLVFSSGSFLEICGVMLTVLLVDRCGRKFLLSVSCAGMTFIFVILDILSGFTVVPFEENWVGNYFPWLPLTAAVLMFVIYDVGCGTVPYILLSELLQTHARVSGITFCYLFHCLLTYSSYTIFQLLVMSSHSSIIIPALFLTACFGGFLFTYHCIPETKGKSLQDIAEVLKEPR